MKTLKELIEFLESMDPDAYVQYGFGSAHSDRGYYEHLAFDPQPNTFGNMLQIAKEALGLEFTGYKGGDYLATEKTIVKIGRWGESGDSITEHTFNLWKYLNRDYDV